MSEYVKFWKKTIFWSKLRDTFGLIGGPTPAGLHEFGAADHWIIISGIIALAGVGLGMWMVDNDKDGVIDLFQ